jgi:hypothetical protein
MSSGVKSAWKEVPIRRRFVLSLFFVAGTHAVLYLVLDAPSHAHSSVGVPIAFTVVLLSGIAVAHFFPRWVTDESSLMAAIGSRRSALGVLLLLCAYLLLSAFPHPLYPNRTTHQGITIHSDGELGPEAHAVIERVTAKIASSAVYDSAAHHRIFVSGSRWKFAIFANIRFRASAIFSPVSGSIFVTKSNLKADRVTARRNGEHEERTLSGVIAHEITHSLLHRIPEGRALPTWKEEGYADYVAGESTFDHARGVRLLKAGAHHPSPAFRYFKYRLLVEYLLDVKRIQFEEFLTEEHDPRRLEAHLVAELHTQPATGT